jgi:hypothetical protein
VTGAARLGCGQGVAALPAGWSPWGTLSPDWRVTPEISAARL